MKDLTTWIKLKLFGYKKYSIMVTIHSKTPFTVCKEVEVVARTQYQAKQQIDASAIAKGLLSVKKEITSVITF